MISVSKSLACFVIYYLILEGNDNFVSAACTIVGEKCCWLNRYVGVEKTINDRPGFPLEITEGFQV